MGEKKPIRKPAKKSGCEVCVHKASDFTVNEEEPEITRCYCRARYFAVNVELMSKECDFFTWDPSKSEPTENNKIEYGL